MLSISLNSRKQGFTTISLHDCGFTLIELIVSISIIAIISVVGLSTLSQSQMRGRDAKRKQDLRSIAFALELFYQKNGRYPCGNGWLSSASGNDWLKDNNVAADPKCTGGGVSIAPTYISFTPKDPLNSGSNVYRFWSEGWSTCQTGHTSYMLVTDLENSNDSETIANKPVDVCGTTTPQGAWGAGFPSNNSFIMTAK